jgi:lysozyme
MIPGINVSQWQFDIDWEEVKRSGVKFAFIKATEFQEKQISLLLDNKLAQNLGGAKTSGVYWSAYHTFRAHVDPVLQAQLFCQSVEEFSSLPPAVELKSAEARGERLNYKIRLFLDEIEKITLRKAIIFTNNAFWRENMGFEKQSHTDWAMEYPLWLAHYTTLWPNSIYPWPAWDFWQYSDKGRLPGIQTVVYLNWFAGSLEELKEKYASVDEGQRPVYVFEDEERGRIPVLINKTPLFDDHKDEQYKGDYQEGPQKPAAPQGFKPIKNPSGQKYTSSQDNWIKEYFF